MVKIDSLISEVLKPLSKRTREIISRRFGLETEQIETLESIGQSLKITRERVRQIEKVGLDSLAVKLPVGSGEFFALVREHLDNFKGIREEQRLLRELAYLLGEEGGNDLRIRFLLFLDKDLAYFPDNKQHVAFWAGDKKFADQVLGFIKILEDSFRKRKSPVAVENMEGHVLAYARKAGLANVEVGILTSYLCLSKVIVFGPFGYIGSSRLKEIAPVNVGDKAYLVLRNTKQPMHFRDLTRVINSQAKVAANFHPVWKKTVEAQTVHNELIKNADFVLVGRGIYALQEWGYKPGTVREVIAGILLKAKKPLSFQEIVKRVKKYKIVKQATILINLQNKKFFKKLADKTYTLVKVPKNVEEI